MKISAFLPVYNEENRIKFILKSVSWCDEIYVLDKTSTDNTVAIAREFGAHVKIIPNTSYYSAAEIEYISECKGDWIFIVTASDIIDKSLCMEIKAQIEKAPSNVGVLYIPFQRYVLGINNKKSPWYATNVRGPFRKSIMEIDHHSVHSALKLKSCGAISISSDYGYLYHLTHVSVDMMMERHIRYWRGEGLNYTEKSLWPALKSVLSSIKEMIKIKTFIGGWDCVALGFAYLSYTMMSFVYKWENKRCKSSQLYDKMRNENYKYWNSDNE